MRKRIFILLGALALSLAVLAGVALLFGPTLFEMQEITVEDFSADGPILDIGGGGEGIIGRMKTTRVVAIDISREELADAPAGPLKIVMDATDLQFLDGSFTTATSFYTLMYIPEAGQKKVFQEVFRVLAPGGRFLIWDVNIQTRPDPSEGMAMYPFRFHLPGGQVVTTAYGVHWPPRDHDLDYYLELARDTGFKVAARSNSKLSFTLILEKS